MCELILYLKTALIAEGRSDIFLIYNDVRHMILFFLVDIATHDMVAQGPESAQLTRGMCKGLDYFSIDSCAYPPPPLPPWLLRAAERWCACHVM